MPVPEKDHRLRRNAVERLPVHVRFDQQRGYVATAEGCPYSLRSRSPAYGALVAQRTSPRSHETRRGRADQRDDALALTQPGRTAAVAASLLDD